MDFSRAAIISNYLSKDYAKDIFRLLKSYHDISASEAASRLDMHIRTVQDFLETMSDFNILTREEVYERKRPYNRYKLNKKHIEIVIDLEAEFNEPKSDSDFRIRERSKSGAKFSTSRTGEYFSALTVWVGTGRQQKERKLNLTKSQGQFLYHLPFPDANPKSIDQIMTKAGILKVHKNEIENIIEELISLKVIKKFD